jgi:Cd2+/Zn2+-exporting ATPase
MNELAALAILASCASGDYRTAGVVAFFMLVGNLVESRTALGARASIESLIRLSPTRARRIETDGGETEVIASELVAGDRIRVRPGDNIPADGKILSGQASINQATITGESVPVDRQPGDEVFAGTQNLTGLLEVEVTRAGEDTTLGHVRQLIVAAEQTRLPIARTMDRYARYYTPTILMVGALVWFFTSDVQRMVSVFVVAIPSAVILAAPTAMVAALSAAARLGILVKNVTDLESAAHVNAVVFDKTGTLTEGRLGVARLAPAEGVDPADLLHAAASAERHSSHPVAAAMVALADEAGVELSEPEELQEQAGRGIQAVVDGAEVVAGKPAWLVERGVPETRVPRPGDEEASGLSLVYVARDGQPLGWIGLSDQVRAQAVDAVRDLEALKVPRVAMFTGDRAPVAERVSSDTGIAEWRAELLPDAKVDFVREIAGAGFRTAVVGDGVNDAPALAAGDIGIAMGAAGSDVAIHSATIALMNNDLRRVPFLIRLSRRTRAVVNGNLVVGLMFILGGLILAGMGYLNPIVAALLHNVSSLVVVFNSARLVRSGEELEAHRGVVL